MKAGKGLAYLIKSAIILVGIAGVSIFMSCSTENPKTEGLIGLYYSEPDLTSIKGISILTSLNQKWDESVDYEGGSSGAWSGYIIAPTSGDIHFFLTTNKWVNLKINNTDSIIAIGKSSEKILTMKMIKGRSYPVNIVFLNSGRHEDIGWFNLKWNWKGKEKSDIPLSSFYYTRKESAKLDFLNSIEESNTHSSDFIITKGKNVIVYYEPGRFAAWPANNGIWNWGDEVLVGFNLGYFKENKYHHAYDNRKPMTRALARSTDGGETWTLEDTTAFSNRGKGSRINTVKINFAAPGFALSNTGNIFYYSYDKGKSWKGPFRYPDFGVGELTSRTDYLVKNRDECFIFLSAKDKKIRASLQDRAMCVKTTDGGINFKFVSWMSENDSIRSVMPATIRISKNHLVSAMRRRLDPPKSLKYGLPENWIDVYESLDNGKSWSFLHKIAHTDNGIRNGNPPSMVRLKSGLLCVVYGYRGLPYSIRAKISKDNGKSWSKEIILRDDARTWDIGYCRSTVRKDDKVVSIYYYSNEKFQERHIEATIWDPNSIELK